jgi:hypothetical protein
MAKEYTPYWEKLCDPRWQKKRLEIMERDGFECTDCGGKTKTLNVHHKYYQKGLSPWEYPDESLTTLCEKCHEKARLLQEFVSKFFGMIGQGETAMAIGFAAGSTVVGLMKKLEKLEKIVTQPVTQPVTVEEGTIKKVDKEGREPHSFFDSQLRPPYHEAKVTLALNDWFQWQAQCNKLPLDIELAAQQMIQMTATQEELIKSIGYGILNSCKNFRNFEAEQQAERDLRNERYKPPAPESRCPTKEDLARWNPIDAGSVAGGWKL